MKRLLRWIGCKTGWYHLRCCWTENGVVCVDCGSVKNRAEYLADLNAGGGW